MLRRPRQPRPRRPGGHGPLAADRYSYSFDGNAQVLDHELVTQNLLPRFDALRFGAQRRGFRRLPPQRPHPSRAHLRPRSRWRVFQLPPQSRPFPRRTIWVGLKNSDDVGIRFDLTAEVYKGATLVGSAISLERRGRVRAASTTRSSIRSPWPCLPSRTSPPATRCASRSSSATPARAAARTPERRGSGSTGRPWTPGRPATPTAVSMPRSASISRARTTSCATGFQLDTAAGASREVHRQARRRQVQRVRRVRDMEPHVLSKRI